MDDFLSARRREIEARGLMGYPQDSERDSARIEGIAMLLGATQGTFAIKLPGRDLVAPWDASLPAQLAYYLCIGDYEHHDLDFAQEFVHPGDKAMELGGGVGITGSALGKASGNPVVVVEPNPALHEAISRTFAANNQDLVLIKAAATGPQLGPCQLAVSPNFWWSSVEAREGLPVIDVPSVAFEALLEEHAPTVLAIDIEGHERALVGSRIHESVRLLLFEIHTPDLGTAQTARIVAWVQSQGFTLKDLRANSWAFERVRAAG